MAFYSKEKRGGYGGPKKFDRDDRGERGGFGKSRGGFGRERGGFGRSSGPGMMFDAVCGECNRDCQVPFRPNGRKPVLCSNCFDKNKSFGDRPQRSFDRPRFADRSERSERPSAGGNTAHLEQKIEMVSQKLDAILDLLKSWEMMEDGFDTEDLTDFGALDLDADDEETLEIAAPKTKKAKKETKEVKEKKSKKK
jgi:CxxC-x17-CxxC domain-containing protein